MLCYVIYYVYYIVYCNLKKLFNSHVIRLHSLSVLIPLSTIHLNSNDTILSVKPLFELARFSWPRCNLIFIVPWWYSTDGRSGRRQTHRLKFLEIYRKCVGITPRRRRWASSTFSIFCSSTHNTRSSARLCLWGR